MIKKYVPLIVLLALAMSLTATPARAQDASATPGQVRDEVRQLISDLNDPNYDYSKVPDRMRQVFQDFRAASNSMDPDRAQQFRQDLMTQLMPVIMQNQQKIQDAVRLAFLKSLQTPMGCSDDEFAAIKPYLEKVANALQASQLNRFGPPRNGTQGPGNPGQGNPSSGGAKVSAVQQAATDLQTTLSDSNASSDLIKNKLDVLRQAQAKAKQDLTVARNALQALLTERQEAVLVEYGLLD